MPEPEYIYKKLYIGTTGPYLVPVGVLIEDSDGDFVGQDFSGIVTDSEVIITSSPTTPDSATTVSDVDARILVAVEVADITDPSELNSVAALKNTSMLVYERVAGDINLWTLYAGDEDCSVDSPYVVAGSSNYWVAVAGSYTAMTLGTISQLAPTATLTDVINKVNELIASLSTYGIIR